jgi:superfamily II DNA/RNA helicase
MRHRSNRFNEFFSPFFPSIIATPGRLLHLAIEMNLDLRSVQYVVFDEADRLFEMGFEMALTEIIHRLPPSRQTLLFSATFAQVTCGFCKSRPPKPETRTSRRREQDKCGSPNGVLLCQTGREGCLPPRAPA